MGSTGQNLNETHQVSTSPIAIVDCGVDWLTCTFGDTANHPRLEASIRRARRVEKAEGNIVHQWGFSGYKGERIAGLEWGYRHDGAIVRLSGFSAQRWWKRFGKLSTNCSRIDVQTTVVYDEHWTRTMRRHWREARHWSIERKHRPRAKAVTGLDGPETIYSGQRVSDIFLRCYHRGSKKGCEKALGHIRYETELKADRGKFALSSLLSCTNADSECGAMTWSNFTNRGYSLKWPVISHQPYSCHRSDSDSQRRLKWLRKQVRPTVEFLVASGLAAECIDALGLQVQLEPTVDQH